MPLLYIGSMINLCDFQMPLLYIGSMINLCLSNTVIVHWQYD